MLPFAFLLGPAIVAGKLFALKVGALTGFRFAENGLDWPSTLEDLKRDHRVLSAIGKDTVKLLPAIARLQQANTLEDVIRSAHDIKRAVDHLPTKTRDGLNKSVGLSTIIDSALKYGLTNCGRAIIKQQAGDEDVPVALARYYFGLFLIGRAGSELAERERTDVILTLTSLHHSRNTPNDRAVNAILQTWLPEKALALGEALMNVREAFALYELAAPEMCKIYIVRAIGGDVVPQNEPDLLEDLTARFPEDSPTVA